MRRRPLLFTAVLVAVLLSSATISARPTGPSFVPVLLYHHLAKEAEPGNNAIITVDEFRWQMDLLRREGYRPITTRQLYDWLSGRRRLPPRAVLITFDDGYQSTFEHAYPVLKEMGWKATLFLITGKVGRQPGRFPYATWEQLRAMVKSGVFEIQAHTHDGHRQVDGQPALLAWTEAEIQADLARLQQELTDHGLPPAAAFAYPFGAHDGEAVRAIAAAGIALGFGGQPGYIYRGDDPFKLRRLTISPGISPCRFLEVVSRADRHCPAP